MSRTRQDEKRFWGWLNPVRLSSLDEIPDPRWELTIFLCSGDYSISKHNTRYGFGGFARRLLRGLMNPKALEKVAKNHSLTQNRNRYYTKY